MTPGLLESEDMDILELVNMQKPSVQNWCIPKHHWIIIFMVDLKVWDNVKHF